MSANAWLGAAAGAVGGIAGSWAMVRFNHVVGGSDHEGGSHAHRRRHATPNDTDATISDEPASDQVASRASEAVLGRPLDEREQRLAAPLFHYAFGALCGAIYGAVAERQRAATAGAGPPFGAAVWLAADEVGLPAAGPCGGLRLAPRRRSHGRRRAAAAPRFFAKWKLKGRACHRPVSAVLNRH